MNGGRAAGVVACPRATDARAAGLAGDELRLGLRDRGGSSESRREGDSEERENLHVEELEVDRPI